MPQIVTVAIASRPQQLNSHYKRLFTEGGQYVFDGNRVTAHFRVGRNCVGRWRLQTLDPGLSLVITPDLRIRKYQRTKRTCVVRIITQFDRVFDALTTLDEAIYSCSQHGHEWSLTQVVIHGEMPLAWQWCLNCGAEWVRFTHSGEVLIWPADAGEIALRTAGALPTLHGPVVGEIAVTQVYSTSLSEASFLSSPGRQLDCEGSDEHGE